MHYISHANNRWHILKGTDIVLSGFVSIETAIIIARRHDIFLTFESHKNKGSTMKYLYNDMGGTGQGDPPNHPNPPKDED